MKCMNLPAVLAVSCFISCTAVRPNPGAIQSPELLMRAILDCAMRHDYDGVRGCVYPTPAYVKGMTSQDCVVELMKHDRGPDYTGDFSYSDQALQRIIDQHLHRFVPLTSDKAASWLRADSIGDELLTKTGGDPGRFRLFDYKGCHILVVELEGCFKLVFWEGMNHLLKDS